MTKEEKMFIEYLKGYYNTPITLVDVGANVGNYVKGISKEMEIGKCYLFEPIQSCYTQLPQKNNYISFNIGLGSSKGKNKFYESIGKESHSSLVNREWLYKNPTYNIIEKFIDIDRLDNIITEDIDLLKIDVEGYELEVLKGSEKLLKNKKIKYIQFEYGGCFKDNKIKMNDVINYLNKYNYKVYSLNENGFKIIDKYEDDYKWMNFYSTHKTL